MHQLIIVVLIICRWPNNSRGCNNNNNNNTGNNQNQNQKRHLPRPRHLDSPRPDPYRQTSATQDLDQWKKIVILVGIWPLSR